MDTAASLARPGRVAAVDDGDAAADASDADAAADAAVFFSAVRAAAASFSCAPAPPRACAGAGLEDAEKAARREGKAADVMGYSFARGSLQAAINIANKIALGQIESGIAGGTDTTSDAPIAVNDRLRKILLDANRAKTTGQKLAALARIRPAMLAPATPTNGEPRTRMSMGQHCELMAKDRALHDARKRIAATSGPCAADHAVMKKLQRVRSAKELRTLQAGKANEGGESDCESDRESDCGRHREDNHDD